MTTQRLRIIQDSREQNPLVFDRKIVDEVLVDGLSFGDYAGEIEVDGEWRRIPIYFERKSVADLYGTMGKGYERFKAEMMRAKDARAFLILIIEGSLAEIHAGYDHPNQTDRSMTGDAMLKKLAMLRVRYDLEVLCMSTRAQSARWIAEVFDAVRRNWTQAEKVDRNENKEPVTGTTPR